ncbi:MAG: thioredoxin domain-containing protein [Proteobacteria bacterium]|nr:thioredoxin domain-containing protein [Pseudomonadota bacterium]
MKRILKGSLATLVCLLAATGSGFAQSKEKGLEYIPTSLKWGLMTPYPMDVVMGKRDSSLFFYYYEKPTCDELCKSQIDERIQTIKDLRPEMQRGQIAFVFRPLVATEEEARAAMSFMCLPEQEVIPRFMQFLKTNDGKTLPVPERFVDTAEGLGIKAADYMACVNDKARWEFYMGHTNFMEKDIGRNTKRRVWIHGMANNFRSDYLRTFMDFLYNTPDFKRATLLKKILPSDIIVGEPDPSKVRVTIYMAPDGEPERSFLNKYLEKFVQVYVNSNQAYVVIRMFNWYRPSSQKPAEFMYCIPKNYKFHMLEQVFASMQRWKVSEETDPSDMLLDLAAFNGLPKKKIASCLKSPRTVQEVARERQAAMDQLKIVVSPVVYFNDELTFVRNPTFAEMMHEMRKLEAIRTLTNKAPVK